MPVSVAQFERLDAPRTGVDDAHCGLHSTRDQLTLLMLISWGVGHADLISGRKMRCSRRWSRVTLMLANRMIERIAANMYGYADWAR